MLIAIDESGSFAEGQTTPSFFIAVHLRRNHEGLQLKEAQLKEWEQSVPGALKTASGEVKGCSLGLEQYIGFMEGVLFSEPRVGITSVAIRPAKNPKLLIENRRSLVLAGLNDAVIQASKLGRVGQARTYRELANHYRNLSYPIILKFELLGNCIMHSLVNSVGRAITGGFDNELVDLEISIDRDFVTSEMRKVFWREILRNQIRMLSEKNPIPLLENWKHDSHPFTDKYVRNGYIDFNELFVHRCEFVDSKNDFGTRIADVVASIFFKSSRRAGIRLPRPLLSCIWNEYSVHLTEVELKNFDLTDPQSLSYIHGDNARIDFDPY